MESGYDLFDPALDKIEWGERVLVHRNIRGCVYRVFWKERGTWLVLKEEESLNPGAALRTLKTLQQLRSKWLVRHYSARVEDGRRIALVMECMDCTLRDVLERHHRMLAEPQVKAIALFALNALADLHDRAKVVHGDLSVSNIFLRGAGELCLGDFSSALPVGDPVEYFAGTVLYTSLEVLQDRGMASRPSSDIWSLGVVLYQCISGEPHPFVEASANDFWAFFAALTAAAQARGPLRQPPHVSSEFYDVLRSMLSWDPGLRPAAKDLLAHNCLSQTASASAKELLRSAITGHNEP